MINIIFASLFTVICLGVFGYGIYRTVKIIKNPMPGTIDYKKEIIKLSYLLLASSVASLVAFIFTSYAGSWSISVGEWFEMVFGSLLFAGSFEIFVYSFMLHYYGKEEPLKLKKWLFRIVIISVFTFLIGFILLTNSFADDLAYPLVNAISFTAGPLTPASHNPGGLTITFYALFILSGAIIVYFLCDHRFYQEYGKHGILESLFFVAFPAGIIGARIGYVIGNWNGDVSSGVESFASRVARGEWWAPLAIWEGGLTIISGALVGVIVGVLWFLWRKKEYSIWLAIDVIIPAVLIAQAIGRIGNFFNCEVYGNTVDIQTLSWLPKIIVNNMQFTPSGNPAPAGMMFVPLFLLEAITNIGGYFIIRYCFGEGMKKYLEMGDLAALYFVWYGYTRVIMEPLRDQTFNMGTKGYWSWFWAFFFVLGGALAIASNHIGKYIYRRKKGTWIALNNGFSKGLVASIVICVIGITLVILGSIFMAQGEYQEILAFNKYNNGLIILISGLSALLMLSVSIPHIIEGLRKREN